MDRVSHFIKAVQQVPAVAAQVPNGMFGVEIVVKTGAIIIDNKNLDIEFNIPFQDSVFANEVEIIVWNIDDLKTGRNFRYNEPITLTAGYRGDTGIIFSGRLTRAVSRWVGADKKTTLYAVDGKSLKERSADNIAYRAGVKASYILKDLIGRLKLPIAVFKTKQDYTYKEAVNVDGSLMDNINQYARICGISVYIQKGKVYAHDVRDNKTAVFTISVDTGLIDTPESYEEEISEENYTETLKGYKVKTLLQHRIDTGACVSLNSRNGKGIFHVKDGCHSFDGTNFITEITLIA